MKLSNIVDEEPAETFDVITAIGVLFHIVDDAMLNRALRNLKTALAPGGVILAGGHFGWVTREIMFIRSGAGLRVTKRIHSLRWWKKHARQAGLEVSQVIRTRNPRGFLVPENNILTLVHLPGP